MKRHWLSHKTVWTRVTQTDSKAGGVFREIEEGRAFRVQVRRTGGLRPCRVGLSTRHEQPGENTAVGPDREGTSNTRLRILVAEPQQLMFTKSLAECLALC